MMQRSLLIRRCETDQATFHTGTELPGTLSEYIHIIRPPNDSTRDRKHQGLRRGIQPFPCPSRLRFWATSRPPRSRNSKALDAQTSCSRRPPFRQTQPSVPVTPPRCASGSGCLRNSQGWPPRGALEACEDPSRHTGRRAVQPRRLQTQRDPAVGEHVQEPYISSSANTTSPSFGPSVIFVFLSGINFTP